MSREFAFLGSEINSKLFDITLQLATDLHVTSHRLRVLELILVSKGLIEKTDIETFIPTDKQAIELDSAREALLGRILRIITENGPAEFPLRDQWESKIIRS